MPIDGAVQAALRKLESDPDLADRTALTPVKIADHVDFVLRSTYFQHNGSIYDNETAQPCEARYPRLLLISSWRYLRNKQ